MNVLEIPLLRWGEPYSSLEVDELGVDSSGDPLVRVSQANRSLIQHDLRQSETAWRELHAFTSRELLEISARAGQFFMYDDLALGTGFQSPDEYVIQLSTTSGLPHSLCRRNMAKIHHVCTEMASILAGLTRGLDLELLDRGFGQKDGIVLSYKSLALAMGVLLPSNSPGVNSIWLPAIALKTPLVIKPGRYDPWTPLRLIEAFIKAGLPRKVIGYYPAGHEAGTNILEGCDRSLLFGSGPTVAPWVGRSEVQIHGPGCSKILIGPDVIQDWIEYKDVLLNSIYENGGRSCINASTIVVPERSHDVADELARELAHLEPRPAADPEACLAAFPQREVAEAIDRQIERSIEAFGALDVTRRYRRSPGRLVEAGGLTYLLPTLLLCSHPDDPLANVEFPFPFVAVVEAGREAMMSRLEPALVVTALTDDPQWMQELWSSRKIERLNQGPLATTHIDWSQPHEGNLFEFLYQRRAVQITGTSNAG